MNKTPVAVALSAAAYSMLFFEENAGINFLLFNILVVVLFYWTKPALRLSRPFTLAAFLSVLSAACILVHGSDLAIFANVVSLVLLGSIAIAPGASVLNNLVQGICSLVTSAILSVVGLFNKKKEDAGKNGKRLSNVITYVVPVFIGLVFLALYRQANPLFARFTEKLRLDFISINWVLFTLGGVVLCCGLFIHRRQESLDDIEATLDGASHKAAPSGLWNQRNAFVLLLVLLNIMALVINSLDVKYLYLGAGLPEDITHKQFVHKGVGNLILSILLGIITLIYFLKRTEESRLVKALAYLWIIQNFLIVISTAMRNHMYIEEALLTYKRIGVYYWLFLATSGLVTTIIKVQTRRNTWYLFRVNAVVAWVVLTLSCAIDWDQFISDHNVKNCPELASLDKKYMLSISEGNIRTLYQLSSEPGFNIDSVYHYRFGGGAENTRLLDEKLYRFLEQNKDTDWRSFNFRRQRVWRDIAALRDAGALDRLDLSTIKGKIDPEVLAFNPNLVRLTLDHLPPAEKSGKGFNDLPKLDTLSVQRLHWSDTTDLKVFRHLKVIRYRADNKTAHVLQERFPAIKFQREP